jgi:hypothetical protein
MRFGERAGRDLRVYQSRGEKRGEKEKEKISKPHRSTLFADAAPDGRLAEDQDVLRLSASKQELRARSFENNTAGGCADGKARKCVYSEKSEADRFRLRADVDSNSSDDIYGYGVAAGGAAAKCVRSAVTTEFSKLLLESRSQYSFSIANWSAGRPYPRNLARTMVREYPSRSCAVFTWTRTTPAVHSTLFFFESSVVSRTSSSLSISSENVHESSFIWSAVIFHCCARA